MDRTYKEFARFIEVIEALRHPKSGCPWDLEQTHESLLPYLIEESYEYLHAVEQKDPKKMEEELGDVLLQVVLHSVIARESKSFDIESVSKGIADKIIRRHPHVFENSEIAKNSKDVLFNWEKIKLEEKKEAGAPEHYIDETYLKFPALLSAHKIGKKSHKIKFDWENAREVRTKVEEEMSEFLHELDKKEVNKALVVEEIGDLLFSMAQLARHLDIDPEAALRAANGKFIRRFMKMEALIKKDHKELLSMNQKEMDLYWDEVKREEKHALQTKK